MICCPTVPPAKTIYENAGDAPPKKYVVDFKFNVVGSNDTDAVDKDKVSHIKFAVLPAIVPVDAFNVPFMVVAVADVPTVIVAPEISDCPILISPVVCAFPISISPV